MNDSFPTAIFVTIVVAMVAVAIFGTSNEQRAAQEVPPATAQFDVEQHSIDQKRAAMLEEACEPLMIGVDEQLTPQQIQERALAYGRCMEIPTVDCRRTPQHAACEGPPR